jgi:hypothetical protein
MRTLTRDSELAHDRDAQTQDGEQTPVYAMSFELFRQSRGRWCWTTMIL